MVRQNLLHLLPHCGLLANASSSLGAWKCSLKIYLVDQTPSFRGKRRQEQLESLPLFPSFSKMQDFRLWTDGFPRLGICRFFLLKRYPVRRFKGFLNASVLEKLITQQPSAGLANTNSPQKSHVLVCIISRGWGARGKKWAQAMAMEVQLWWSAKEVEGLVSSLARPDTPGQGNYDDT